ncbi:cytochrome b5 [Drosophila subobscura]|uniref:cytochrome b5 n=1 Tax=Drosophila subobscura TaxID=7241 RepID=UPI00155A0EE4|nr:cytochrome b5 [Drosophila subobscura]
MSQLYELSEVAEQTGKKGKPCWIIIKGNVYDVTKFLSEHPGGEDLLLEYGGKDASKAFRQAGHSSDAEKELKNFKIGELRTTTTAPIQVQPTLDQDKQKRVSSPAPTDDAQPMQKSSGSGFLCCC